MGFKGDFPPEVGRYFQVCRENAGITQRELSEALGYTSPQIISNFERGLADLPLKKLRKAALLCKVDREVVRKMYVDYVNNLYKSELY